jgi:hypothetical protein
MIKIKIPSVLAAAIGVLLLSATPALAEFTAQGKLSQGKGEMVETKVEAGGAAVVCQALATGSSAVKWALVNEKGELAKTGSRLLLKVAKWGECKADSSGLHGAKATVKECELEAVQVAKENPIEVATPTACNINTSSCEIKLEPAGGKQFKNSFIYDGGKATQNLVIRPTIVQIATHVTSGCPALGINASEEGLWHGVGEAQQVKAAAIFPTFAISANPLVYRAGEEGLVTITNIGAPESRTVHLEFEENPAKNFEPTQASLLLCEEKKYALGETCSFTTKDTTTTGWQLIEIPQFGLTSGVLLR